MKLKRRLLLALAPLALFVLALFPLSAYAQTGTYVFDEEGVLSQEEFSQLESQAAGYADTYRVGTYLLLCDNMGTSDPSSSERREFARDYYEQHSLGVGSNRDGIIFVIAVESRDYVTVKHFADSSDDPFSNSSVDVMEDAAVDQLSSDRWYAGGKAYLDTVGEHLAYFAKNGKQWKKPNTVLTVVKVAATLLIPLFIAIGVVSSEKDAMKTARMKTEAANYVEPDSFVLHASTDQFVNRSISATPIPKDDDDDSDGGWSDMGGGFSGSDGGKF